MKLPHKITSLGQKRIYSQPEESFAASMWIGTTFQDAGLTMQVSRVGTPYRWGNCRLIDFEAIVIAEPHVRRRTRNDSEVVGIRTPQEQTAGTDVDALERNAHAAREGRRVYNMSEKSFLRASLNGLWVGSEFEDSGLIMVVKNIGRSYRWGKHKVIDVEAVMKQLDDQSQRRKDSNEPEQVPEQQRD